MSDRLSSVPVDLGDLSLHLVDPDADNRILRRSFHKEINDPLFPEDDRSGEYVGRCMDCPGNLRNSVSEFTSAQFSV